MAEQASRVRDGPLVLRRYAEAMTDDLFEHMYPWMPWCHADLTREEFSDWTAGDH